MARDQQPTVSRGLPARDGPRGGRTDCVKNQTSSARRRGAVTSIVRSGRATSLPFPFHTFSKSNRPSVLASSKRSAAAIDAGTAPSPRLRLAGQRARRHPKGLPRHTRRARSPAPARPRGAMLNYLGLGGGSAGDGGTASLDELRNPVDARAGTSLRRGVARRRRRERGRSRRRATRRERESRRRRIRRRAVRDGPCRSGRRPGRAGPSLRFGLEGW